MLEPVGEALGDARAQLVEPLPGLRRDEQRVREPVREPAAAQRVDRVDLVQHELARQVGGADLGSTASTASDLLVEPLVGRRRVDDVQDEVGDERLLERRREALDELVRQPADEADGVGDQVAAAVVLERRASSGRASRTAGRRRRRRRP